MTLALALVSEVIAVVVYAFLKLGKGDSLTFNEEMIV